MVIYNDVVHVRYHGSHFLNPENRVHKVVAMVMYYNTVYICVDM